MDSKIGQQGWTARVDSKGGQQEWTARVDSESGQQEWTTRVDSREANIVAEIKLTHEALFDPAGRDGPGQLIVMQGHHLQLTVVVQSGDSYASSNSIQVKSCKIDES